MRIIPCLTLVLGLGTTQAAAQAIDFTAYHTPAQVELEISRFQTRFPALVRIVSLGNSLENKPIRAIKISDNPAVDETGEGDVLFVALHHAREWLATETALYIAEQILTRYATDPKVKADVDNLQIWIVPVVNPDGYLHTDLAATPLGYRYWRKNRRPNSDGTFGVDLNRNWGFQWGLLSGASNTPSYDTYYGTGAFSEPETQRLRTFIDSRPMLKAFVSYHTYGELFLRPWAYTTADPPGESTLLSLYERSRDAISAVHGHVYVPNIWYTSSGEATDYLWGEKRIAGFTPELRPTTAQGGGGLAGFSFPPSIIIPTGEENVPAALALVHDAAAREVWIRDHATDTGAEPSAVMTATGWSTPFWVSPDIWTTPAQLTEGTTVTLHVRVHNNFGGPVSNVRVEAYWTDPRIALEFPALSSTLIDAQTVNVPPPGRTLTMSWTVPTGTNSWGERHWCVGVVIKHQRDMPLTTQAQRSSNIAIRNFTTVEAAAAGASRQVAATNYLDTDAELRVLVSPLPAGWEVHMPDVRELRLYALDRRERPTPQSLDPATIVRKGRLLKATGRVLRPGESVLIPVTIVPPAGAPQGTTADINVQGLLLPLVAGKREPQGNGYTFRVVVR
jgi:zinc carboxypeptidase